MNNQLMPIDSEALQKFAEVAGKVATKPIVILKDVTINIHNTSTRNGLGVTGLFVWFAVLGVAVYAMMQM